MSDRNVHPLLACLEDIDKQKTDTVHVDRNFTCRLYTKKFVSAKTLQITENAFVSF